MDELPGDVRAGDIDPAVDVFDTNSEGGIAKHPCGNETRAEGLVVIIHGGLLTSGVLRHLGKGTGDGFLEGGVHVFLSIGGVFDSGCVGPKRGLGLERRESLVLVAAFGSPGNLCCL